jgi:hypothetical protein
MNRSLQSRATGAATIAAGLLGDLGDLGLLRLLCG